MGFIRNKKDFILGVLSLGIGLFILFSDNIIKGFSLFRTQIWLSKADSYLRILGALLAVIAVIIIVRSLLPSAKASDEKEEKQRFDYIVLISFASFFIYILLLKLLGFIPDTIWFVALISFMLRARETHLDWRDKRALCKAVIISVVYAIVLVLLLSFVFTQWLNVRLP